METKPNSKNSHSSSFDIYIVEDHNDALEPIYSGIGKRKIPFDNLTMLHFDSHPDLGIPDKFKADLIYNKQVLFEYLSIESWILPAVFAGHISTVIWIKPKWSCQIDSGKYEIQIGKNATTGYIRCNSKEPYFLSESLYTHESNLLNKRSFLLYVCDFDSILDQDDSILQGLLSDSLKANRLIFDIDLDFFSTMDPFKRMFSNNAEYEIFKAVYNLRLFDISTQDSNFENKYEELIVEKESKLQEIYNGLQNRLKDVEKIDANSSDLDKLADIIQLRSLDFEILHSFGSGLDDRSLPDHVSTNDELEDMFKCFNLFLNKYLRTNELIPSILTIARSSLDDYCPPNQVDYIQEQTLNSVQKFFKKSINSVNKCF